MARVLNSQKSTFTYERTKGLLLERIVGQGLSNGDLLPSMRELGDMLCGGRIKPARMAVQLLVEEGVLASHRGRGVSVRDADRARDLLARSRGGNGSPSPRVEYDMSPFTIRRGRRALRFALGKGAPLVTRVWEEIVAEFNVASSAVHADIVLYEPTAASVDLTLEADVIKVQAHNRQRLPEALRFIDLSALLGPEFLNRFHPALYPVCPEGGAVFGLPVTAVAHCAAINEGLMPREDWPPVPLSWDGGFSQFADFILALRERAPERVKAVVHSSHNLLFYLALAGLTTGDGVSDLPEFTAPAVQDLLIRFARVYCRPDCYAVACGSGAPSTQDDALLREGHTYDYGIFSAAAMGRRSDFVPLPTEGNGGVPVVPHLFGINARSAVVEDAVAFLMHLASDATTRKLLGIGHIPGRKDTGDGLHPVLRHTLEHGRAVECASSPALMFFSEAADRETRKWRQGEITVGQLVRTLERERRAALQRERDSG